MNPLSPVQSSRKNALALTAICLSAMMLGLEITSVPSILPTLEKLLPASFQQLQWIMNAYTIAMCATLMAMGALGDRCGRKRIFGIGIVFFGLSSLVCGLADNAPLLIGARIIQGMSAAAMLASQVAVLMGWMAPAIGHLCAKLVCVSEPVKEEAIHYGSYNDWIGYSKERVSGSRLEL